MLKHGPAMPSVGFELVDPSDSPCLRPGVRLDLRWHKPSQADHKKPMCQAEQDQLQKVQTAPCFGYSVLVKASFMACLVEFQGRHCDRCEKN